MSSSDADIKTFVRLKYAMPATLNDWRNYETLYPNEVLRNWCYRCMVYSTNLNTIQSPVSYYQLAARFATDESAYRNNVDPTIHDTLKLNADFTWEKFFDNFYACHYIRRVCDYNGLPSQSYFVDKLWKEAMEWLIEELAEYEDRCSGGTDDDDDDDDTI